MDDLILKLAQTPEYDIGKSPYIKELLEEQRVLPSIAGLPRIIRVFV